VIGKNGIPFHTHKREKQTAASFQNMFFGATCPQASNHIAQKGHSNEGVFMCACVCCCLTLTKSSKVVSCYEQQKKTHSKHRYFPINVEMGQSEGNSTFFFAILCNESKLQR